MGQRSGRTGLAKLISQLVVGIYLLTFLTVFYKTKNDTSSINPQLKIGLDSFLATGRDDITARQPKTLALLYPPGLPGGYRNQVIRFLSLCTYAKQHNIQQLLLPSLIWTTHMDSDPPRDKKWYPVPMKTLFDVAHWNQIAATEGSPLPLLVEEVVDSDCWTKAFEKHLSNETLESMNPLRVAALQQGGLDQIQNIFQAVMTGEVRLSSRKQVDLLPLVSHCKNPLVYGGGLRSGRLWNDYQISLRNSSAVPFRMDEWIYRALWPAPRWRGATERCTKRHNHYVALHARVEPEIMAHACGAEMEWNLTKILGHVSVLANSLPLELSVSGVFLAVSRSEMETLKRVKQPYLAFASENLRLLNRLTQDRDDGNLQGMGVGPSALPVFECGGSYLKDFYRTNPSVPDQGTLLQSVINFHAAVMSDVFVGVAKSSYSTDIWRTRYFLGKGSTNYEYTREGVRRVGNGGLPNNHKQCAMKK